MWRGLVHPVSRACEQDAALSCAYFGWNSPSAMMSSIFLSDSSASGVQRYSLSSRRRRDRVHLMAGRPRLRGMARGAPPWATFGFVTRPSLTRRIGSEKDGCRLFARPAGLPGDYIGCFELQATEGRHQVGPVGVENAHHEGVCLGSCLPSASTPAAPVCPRLMPLRSPETGPQAFLQQESP